MLFGDLVTVLMLLEHVDIEVTRNLFLCIDLFKEMIDQSRKKEEKKKKKKKRKGLPARGHLRVKIREGKERCKEKRDGGL